MLWTLRCVLRYVAVAVFLFEIQCSAQSAIKIGTVMERGILAVRGMVFVSLDEPAVPVPEICSAEVLTKNLTKPIVISEGSLDGNTLTCVHNLIHRRLIEFGEIARVHASGEQNEVWRVARHHLRGVDIA